MRELHPCVHLSATGVTDRSTYLRRPDLGRKLTAQSFRDLQAGSASEGMSLAREQVLQARALPPRVVVAVSDGLCAHAAERHASSVLSVLFPRLRELGAAVAAVVIVPYARVGVINDIGAATAADVVLILLGERPGLGTSESLGAYFGYRPRPGCTDADRNCISNIRPDGLPPATAARKIAALISRSCHLRRSGTELKEIDFGENGTLAG